jgi:hypothetical protein
LGNQQNLAGAIILEVLFARGGNFFLATRFIFEHERGALDFWSVPVSRTWRYVLERTRNVLQLMVF